MALVELEARFRGSGLRGQAGTVRGPQAGREGDRPQRSSEESVRGRVTDVHPREAVLKSGTEGQPAAVEGRRLPSALKLTLLVTLTGCG